MPNIDQTLKSLLAAGVIGPDDAQAFRALFPHGPANSGEADARTVSDGHEPQPTNPGKSWLMRANTGNPATGRGENIGSMLLLIAGLRLLRESHHREAEAIPKPDVPPEIPADASQVRARATAPPAEPPAHERQGQRDDRAAYAPSGMGVLPDQPRPAAPPRPASGAESNPAATLPPKVEPQPTPDSAARPWTATPVAGSRRPDAPADGYPIRELAPAQPFAAAPAVNLAANHGGRAAELAAAHLLTVTQVQNLAALPELARRLETLETQIANLRLVQGGQG